MFTRKQVTINTDVLRKGNIVFATFEGKSKNLLAIEVNPSYVTFVEIDDINKEYVFSASDMEKMSRNFVKCDIVATTKTKKEVCEEARAHISQTANVPKSTMPTPETPQKNNCDKKQALYDFACKQDRETFEKIINSLSNGDKNFEEVLQQVAQSNVRIIKNKEELKELLNTLR